MGTRSKLLSKALAGPDLPGDNKMILLMILETLEDILGELQAQGSDEEEEAGPTSLSDR